MYAYYTRLESKVVIITGGASGIGASSATLFWEHGAFVVIADIRDELGQALVGKLGKRASYVHCDVSKEGDISSLVDTTVAKHGKLDVMYNNAGVVDRPWSSILESIKADMDRVVGVNLYGAFYGAKHAARVMVPRRGGCILFTTSSCTAISGFASHPYMASKCAIVGMAKSLAGELGQHGIRVNCISPHAVAGTRISSEMKGLEGMPAEASKEALGEMGNLKGQVLEPESIAQAALFLASDEANYVSGLNLLVDGGFSVVNPSLMIAAMGMGHPRQ
ncbi:hypothetical protein CDL15_Pgr003223 [Punica granatum]|uniref:Tropinone reductase-like 1 n=1 Tax=Punica granatum TaxID=22663 RepID=A0A218X3X6_PUNGR|nr:hypothetical protein CDL15_Pgr003223 [Punica granatum]